MKHRLKTPSILLFSLVLVAVVLTPTAAFAATSRLFQGYFSGSSGENALAIDQSSEYLYETSSNNDNEGVEGGGSITRLTLGGAPANFTEGSNAGTNTLTGFHDYNNQGGSVAAVDNSSGPLRGDLYVAENQKNTLAVSIFSPTGAKLGAITGAGAPEGILGDVCGVSVDHSNGSVYIAASTGNSHPLRIWRYAPASPSAPLDDADYTVTGIAPTAEVGCNIAVASGNIYATANQDGSGPLYKYSASAFTAAVPQVNGTALGIETAGLAVDPTTGDVYANEGDRVSVLDSAGEPLYHFAAAAYLGAGSTGIALDSAGNVYVTALGHQVAVFGQPTQVAQPTNPQIATFGPDGTSATSFSFPLSRLAFNQASRRLYALDANTLSPGLYGFDASAPPAFQPRAGFSPLATAVTGSNPGLAVDETVSPSPSAGNLYFASEGTDLLYGFDSSGAALASPFPLDPAVSPGAPSGSPKNLCGTAVDSSGNVWVANASTKKILEYNSAGVYQASIDTFAQGAPCQLAFDTNDDFYVATENNGVWKFTAASSYATATEVAPSAENGSSPTLAVDPSTHDLYVAQGKWVDEYAAAGDLLDEFATGAELRGVVVDEVNHDIYVADQSDGKVLVFGPGVPYPEVTTRPATGPTNTTTILNGTVTGQGLVLTDCHFEYVSEEAYRLTGFSDLSSGGSTPCSPAAGLIPADLEDHPVTATATGLVENTGYRFRLSATNANGSVTTEAAGFTSAGPPTVETVGSPLRTATTVRLDARVDPRNAATEYHFEYGTQGPCDANPCQSTDPQPASAAGGLIELVSQEIEGLQPNTTYHYRAIADNGNPDGPVYGEDMTVRTRTSDVPLSHGHFPGPSGSDRAWEQVNVPDTSGNPVNGGWAFSNDGDRAIYTVAGGLTQGSTGNALTPFFAERTSEGWQTKNIYPARSEVFGEGWTQVAGSEDLSNLTDMNTDGFFSIAGPHALFHIGAPAKPVLLRKEGAFTIVSGDGTRVVTRLSGALDPAYPAATEANYYDIGSGSPHLLGLLPGNTLPACGATGNGVELFEPGTEGTSAVYFPLRAYNWLSPDGSLFVFPSKGNNCSGPAELYMRDIETEETVRITPAAISGPQCSAALVKATPGAVFFWTQSRLVPADTAIFGKCAEGKEEVIKALGGDIYRYDVASHAVTCVTCVAAPGLEADVQASSKGALSAMAVAADGSRVYFTSPHRLLPGAPEQAIYRVDVASGELAYVAPGSKEAVGEAGETSTVSPDGKFMVFKSNNSALDSLTDSDNGGTKQYYIYDDEDRSLICASCSQNGSAPVAEVPERLVSRGSSAQAPNITPLAAGGDFAFVTPTPLVSADQNTAARGQNPEVGDDVYEWRDGRVLLVTDGLTSWAQAPEVSGITPSGSDLFFTAAAQYTPDALDAIKRLYDARIGGGIEFPAAPKPCPLEVCQGTPKGAPEEAEPGSAFFAGPGNLVPLVSALPAKVAPKKTVVSRAAMLARALRACRSKLRSKRKRKSCEVAARKRYGARPQGKRASVRAGANDNRRSHR